MVIAVALLCSGCVKIGMPEKDYLMANAKYSELQKKLENETKKMSSMPNSDLVKLCTCYTKLKNYQKLFECTGKLDERISQSNKMSYKYNFLTGCRGDTAPQDISLQPYILRSEAFIDLGDYNNALQNAQKAYDLLEKMQWSYCDKALGFKWDIRQRQRILGLLALIHALKGDTREALYYADLLGKSDIGIVSYGAIKKEREISLAKAYMALGKYDKVLEYKNAFMDALESFALFILGESPGDQNIATFINLPRDFVLAKANFETGKTAVAREEYDKLLQNPYTKDNGEIYWPILYDRGRISQKEGNRDQARDYYKQSIGVVESQRATIHTEANKIGFVGNKQEVYHQMVDCLLTDKRDSEGFEYVERAKSRALVDLLASKRDFASRGDETIDASVQEMAHIESETQGFNVAALKPQEREQKKTRGIEIKQQIRNKDPELYSLVAVSTPSAAEIQSGIGDGETLLEYYYFKDSLYAFIVTNQTVKSVKLDGNHLAEDIRQLRKSLENPQSREYAIWSAKLYQRLIQPVEQDIKTRNIMIVPHGILHYLPFSVLNNGKNYLIETHDISYLPSASVLQFLRKKGKAQKTGTALILGNPDLNDPRYDLKYAEQEALTVAGKFPKPTVLLRKDASKEAFRKLGNRYEVIHLASHGTFESDSPLDSGLLLAKKEGDDGFLRVSDLYSMRLNADLVTLSACETGLGKINSGDDIVGLSRGFLYAGSSSIVASLWKVDDLATSDLMADFYSNLKHKDKREALRAAQLSGLAKYQHPFYWASFQLTGKAD